MLKLKKRKKRRGVENPNETRRKTASCFVKVISEVLLSGRSHDLIEF